MLQENLERVNQLWKRECLKLAEPLSEGEIINIFAELRIPISSDVIKVYSNLGGFDEDDMDSECLTFWTVKKIRHENKANSEHVYFADFLIDSHQYAFKYKNADVSSIHVHYSENERYKIADSFDDFFELYLENPAKLFV